MNPYDLPEEFSHLQAQDMGKLGALQDLVYGINKVLQPKHTKSAKLDIEPLVKRVFLFVEDGNYDDARRYCEKILDRDPENPEVYLAKLLIDLELRRESDLSEVLVSFYDNPNYKK